MFAPGPRAVGFTIVWPEGVIFSSMMTYHAQFLLLVVAGWVNRQQQDVIDYLQRGEPRPVPKLSLFEIADGADADPKDVLHEDDQSILVTGSLVLPQLSVGGQPLTGLRAGV